MINKLKYNMTENILIDLHLDEFEDTLKSNNLTNLINRIDKLENELLDLKIKNNELKEKLINQEKYINKFQRFTFDHKTVIYVILERVITYDYDYIKLKRLNLYTEKLDQIRHQEKYEYSKIDESNIGDRNNGYFTIYPCKNTGINAYICYKVCLHNKILNEITIETFRMAIQDDYLLGCRIRILDEEKNNIYVSHIFTKEETNPETNSGHLKIKLNDQL